MFETKDTEKSFLF